jgi:muramoyltetrapeptide carboxypeptidase
MIQRRSLLISGATTALGALISGKATASTRGSTPHLPPLRKGARLRAINPGTWIEPDTAFDALIDRCAAEDWTLEIPPSVTEQWRYFSGRDQERAGELARAWTDPSIDAVISLGGGWGSARVLEAGFRIPPPAQMEPGLFRQLFPAARPVGRRATWRHSWLHQRARGSMATNR